MWLLQALRKQLNASRALKSLETPQQRAERKAEAARERQARKEEKAPPTKKPPKGEAKNATAKALEAEPKKGKQRFGEDSDNDDVGTQPCTALSTQGEDLPEAGQG